jgi:hypothetical protein
MQETKAPVVRIDASRIVGWESFHDVFAEALGIPVFYGRNMNAWIDCLTCLDQREAGMTRIHAPPGGVVTLVIDHASELSARCPELYDALVECAAFVNWRRIERGEPSVLGLAFHSSAAGGRRGWRAGAWPHHRPRAPPVGVNEKSTTSPADSTSGYAPASYTSSSGTKGFCVNGASGAASCHSIANDASCDAYDV